MKILVVDDDNISCIKLVALFKAYGTCDIASNGEEALMLFENAHKALVPYELITMDIEMPGMNGQDVVNKMRDMEMALKLNASHAAKILMVTVKGAFKDVSVSYYRGCNGYLIKPTTPQNLAKALEDVGISKVNSEEMKK